MYSTCCASEIRNNLTTTFTHTHFQSKVDFVKSFIKFSWKPPSDSSVGMRRSALKELLFRVKSIPSNINSLNTETFQALVPPSSGTTFCASVSAPVLSGRWRQLPSQQQASGLKPRIISSRPRTGDTSPPKAQSSYWWAASKLNFPQIISMIAPTALVATTGGGRKKSDCAV